MTEGADEVVGYEIMIYCELWTVNRERTLHWAQHQEMTNAARWAAKVAALDAKLPHLERVRIVVRPYQARGPLADVGAHTPPAKAAIDGLRDAGVLDDDTPEYVTSIEMLPPVKTTARSVGLALTIIPVG